HWVHAWPWKSPSPEWASRPGPNRYACACPTRTPNESPSWPTFARTVPCAWRSTKPNRTSPSRPPPRHTPRTWCPSTTARTTTTPSSSPLPPRRKSTPPTGPDRAVTSTRTATKATGGRLTNPAPPRPNRTYRWRSCADSSSPSRTTTGPSSSTNRSNSWQKAASPRSPGVFATSSRPVDRPPLTRHGRHRPHHSNGAGHRITGRDGYGVDQGGTNVLLGTCVLKVARRARGTAFPTPGVTAAPRHGPQRPCRPTHPRPRAGQGHTCTAPPHFATYA